MLESCVNHTQSKALSQCHACARPFCAECLIEGKNYYYCSQSSCREVMKQTGDELPVAEAPAENPQKLITIAKYLYPYEADLAKARLESEGIPAFAADEYIVRFDWFYSNAVGGIRLQVAEPDAELAREILASDLSRDPESEFLEDPTDE